MSQLILQPSGSKDSQFHFDSTMRNPVSLELIAEYVSDTELSKLKQIYPEGKIFVWGVVPGSNTSKWERIKADDIALFAGNMRIFASGRVTYKIHNKLLAHKLWGNDNEDRTWEHIYFLEDIKKQDIHYRELNKCLGYKENNIIQGFTVIPEQKAEAFLDKYSLNPRSSTETLIDEYESIIRDLDPSKPLDGKTFVQVRKEQSFLRDYLFKNKLLSVCGICGKEYPVDLLVAAHIKRRADCSVNEKLDYQNNVMPVCKMGCDDLYEKGYISISKGKVVRCPDKYLTPSLKHYTDIIHNKSCEYATDGNKEYFKWHENNKLKK